MHRISIPKDEAGPRIFFVVPGCSLTKQNIIEEEEIEDHGYASLEDGKRMMNRIGELGFEPYLLAVLKSLVGSEIMQNDQIYYLPQEGEIVERTTPFSQYVASSSRGFPLSSSNSLSREEAKADAGVDEFSETESEDSLSADPNYQLVEEEEEEDQRPAKRPRGRPRKALPAQQEGTFEPDASSGSKAEDSASASVAKKGKKRTREPSVNDQFVHWEYQGVPEAKKTKLAEPSTPPMA